MYCISSSLLSLLALGRSCERNSPRRMRKASKLVVVDKKGIRKSTVEYLTRIYGDFSQRRGVSNSKLG